MKEYVQHLFFNSWMNSDGSCLVAKVREDIDYCDVAIYECSFDGPAPYDRVITDAGPFHVVREEEAADSMRKGELRVVYYSATDYVDSLKEAFPIATFTHYARGESVHDLHVAYAQDDGGEFGIDVYNFLRAMAYAVEWVNKHHSRDGLMC